MINNFEEYTKVQSFSGGFTQWRRGDLAHSAKVCINDTKITRAIVRKAFEADSESYGEVFGVNETNT